jgi:glycosyltransferase involved in cell wall biosynthesis
MGTIDWRVDLGIVAEAARRLPDFTFAVVGRINNEQRDAAARLGSMANVVVTGAVPYDEGRAYTAAFDVGLIQFFPGRVGDAINPVKMYMYLAAGKPVVSTWCTECVRAAPLVTAAKGAEGFAAAIRHAVEDDTAADRADRIAFASCNTWADRARDATAHLDESGLFRPTAPRTTK